jgi:hypothetical protein
MFRKFPAQPEGMAVFSLHRQHRFHSIDAEDNVPDHRHFAARNPLDGARVFRARVTFREKIGARPIPARAEDRTLSPQI